MAAEPPTPTRDPSGHTCQLFDSRESLVETVAAFVSDGLNAGDSLLAVMWPENWVATVRCLRQQGLNPSAGLASGQITVLNAATTLETFRRHGHVDPELFDASVGGLVRGLAAKGPRLRIYGEMVDVLAMEGDFRGALQLEALWNDLVARLPFSLFCGYAAVNFGNPRAADALRLTCRAHTHVRTNPQDVLASFLLQTVSSGRSPHTSSKEPT